MLIECACGMRDGSLLNLPKSKMQAMVLGQELPPPGVSFRSRLGTSFSGHFHCGFLQRRHQPSDATRMWCSLATSFRSFSPLPTLEKYATLTHRPDPGQARPSKCNFKADEGKENSLGCPVMSFPGHSDNRISPKRLSLSSPPPLSAFCLFYSLFTKLLLAGII